MSLPRCLCLGAALIFAAPALTAQDQYRCTDAAFAALDFWVGEWTVTVADREVGVNRISKVLDGCAIREEWTAADGGTGQSLFYYLPARRAWRQVWVTGRALAPGGVKEKELVRTESAGGIRFQGTIALADGRSYLDRTTLSEQAEGRVRQLIEISTDGGASWRPTFDAIYHPVRHDSSHATPESVVWQPAAWPGVSIATVERSAAGFTFWMKLPHGFWILPHTHPSAKRINVIRGALRVARGAAFDSTAGELLHAGGFTVIPAETAHYEGAVGETIVQFSAVGKWGTTFVKPEETYRVIK
ncbi:MAG: cupin domain-containing protein [Gemmatimonadales bacterium]